MNDKECLLLEDDQQQIKFLVERLAESESAIQVWLDGQVDAVIPPATMVPRLLQQAQDWLWRSERHLRSICDAVACGMSVENAAGVIVHANRAACKLLGLSLEQVQGRRSTDLPIHAICEDRSPFPAESYPSVVVRRTGVSPRRAVLGIVLGNAQPTRWLLVDAELITELGSGRAREVVTTFVDITDRMQAEQTVRSLSTPILPIQERLLLLPMVGVINQDRAAQLTDQLLSAIRSHRARVVVLDVTGVAFVDSYVANHLVRTVEASRLLGATVIVTGISSHIAETLVKIGSDLGQLLTVGDLQGGIELAQRLLSVVTS